MDDYQNIAKYIQKLLGHYLILFYKSRDIEDELTDKIGKKVAEWGINIEKVTLTDLAEITSIRVISDGDANRQSIVPLTDTTNN